MEKVVEEWVGWVEWKSLFLCNGEDGFVELVVVKVGVELFFDELEWDVNGVFGEIFYLVEGRYFFVEFDDVINYICWVDVDVFEVSKGVVDVNFRNWNGVD